MPGPYMDSREAPPHRSAVLYRLDRLAGDGDDDRWTAVVSGTLLVVLDAIDRSADIAKAHRHALGLGNHQIVIARRVADLAISLQRVAALCAVERAAGLIAVARADGIAVGHTVLEEPHGRGLEVASGLGEPFGDQVTFIERLCETTRTDESVIHQEILDVAPGRYTLTVAVRDPRDFKLEGSNNGTTWTLLDSQTNVVWQARYQVKEFNFSNSTAFKPRRRYFWRRFRRC